MKKIFLSIFLFIFIFMSYLLLINMNVFASSSLSDLFEGYSAEFTNEYLSQQTNTLSFNTLDYETGNYNYINTGIQVSNEEPMMTVFTHGYGASDYHWSNEYEFLSDSVRSQYYNLNFSYDPDSFIEQLRIASNADVYFAEMKEVLVSTAPNIQYKKEFYLYKVDYSKKYIVNYVEMTLNEYYLYLKPRNVKI